MCVGPQELQPYLQSHRSWLSGLWASSSNSASFESRKEQALLLSQLLGSLLKCCNPEVGHPACQTTVPSLHAGGSHIKSPDQ